MTGGRDERMVVYFHRYVINVRECRKGRCKSDGRVMISDISQVIGVTKIVGEFAPE